MTVPPAPLRLLILGGTTEASRLAARLARNPAVDTLLSLAGRTLNPAPSPVRSRVGGFGGADGLATFLAVEGIGAVVDATHPFAARITANAARACERLGLPRLVLTRPPWRAGPGDRWEEVADLDAAAEALGPVPRTVFLTTGRLGLATFRAAPQHRYLVRTIDPPDPADLPPHCHLVSGRGPFPVEAETELLRRYGVEVLITKNSGAAASAAKLEAARALHVPVLMVARPPVPPGRAVTEPAEAEAWVLAHAGSPP